MHVELEGLKFTNCKYFYSAQIIVRTNLVILKLNLKSANVPPETDGARLHMEFKDFNPSNQRLEKCLDLLNINK